MPCTEKRARLLLERRKARIHSMYPFTIRLVNRTVQESAKQPLRCKLDPGSQVTGIAIVREDGVKQVVLSLIELSHRGSTIRNVLQSRAGKRRRRRSQLRYRAPRFENRAKPSGWLPPSLLHRIATVVSWVNRIRKRAPLTGITCERVRFDMQKLIHPEIDGAEYQQGTLFGYEIREYLLEKWSRKCAYCDIQNVPLQIDHMVPKSHGGSDRIDNLTLACASCNQKKGSLSLEMFSPHRAKKLSSAPNLHDAAAVNATRNALWKQLTELSIPCEAGTGGQTKYNRNRLGVPKTHALDAACTGTVFQLQNWLVPTQQIKCTGRGSYQRTRLDRFGFPRGYLLQQKKVCGFQTGDQVISSVPSGKKKGTYTGRVAIRASGYFNIQTAEGVVQGISSKNCRLAQHADGYHYLGNLGANFNSQTKEQRLLPALKAQVSALSIG
ncbi:MAG: endonuclease [Parachlamydiales bacterium]|nr:endonuclease [Parachlamydiales bacterium]